MMTNQMRNERKLIGKVLKGNVKAFEEIISNYQRLVSTITFRLLSNEYDREEVCQEVFIKIYQNLSGFRFKSKLSTWIGKITYNYCLNYMQKQKKHQEQDLHDSQNENPEYIFRDDPTFVNASNPEILLEKKDKSVIIQNYIKKLPQTYNTILTLFHINEFSYDEISEIMDLPQGTVKSYLFRARRLLKEKILSSHKEEEFVQ